MTWWVIPLTVTVITTIIAIVGEYQFSNDDYHIITYVYNHFWFSFLLLIGYLSIGAVYSVIQWWLHINANRKEYLVFRAELIKIWLEEKRTKKANNYAGIYVTDDNRITDAGEKNILSRFSSHKNGLEVPLTVAENVDLISSWITLWPLCIPCNILFSIAKRVFNLRQVKMVGAIMQRMSNRAFSPPLD